MSAAHVHINVSAKLNTGNRLNIKKKSLTHHKKILSIKFPIVHQIKNIVARFQMWFFLYQIRINKDIIIVSTITKMIFTGKDREIPVLKDGSKNCVFDKKALS